MAARSGSRRKENLFCVGVLSNMTSVHLQMLLWVFLSLLPLVDGAHMTAGGAAVGPDAGDTVGLLRGQEELELPVTLPEAVVDEEQEDGGHPYSTWHALYGTEALMIMSFLTASCFSRQKTGRTKGICTFLSLYVH